MFFRFPPDARWIPERSAVEFSVGVGEYEDVVRISRRVFPNVASRGPTPERCLEAYHLHRTRLELIAERKARRRQLTDDGNVEITGRDLRKCEPRGDGAPGRLSWDFSMSPPNRRLAKPSGVPRSDQDRHSAGGLGNHFDQMNAWLDANCGADG